MSSGWRIKHLEKYELKSLGYDFDRVISRVAESMGMDPKEVTAFGKSPQTVKARRCCVFGRIGSLGRPLRKLQGGSRLLSRQQVACRNEANKLKKNADLIWLTDKGIKTWSAVLFRKVFGYICISLCLCVSV